MDNEKRKMELMEKKDGLKRKGNLVRLAGACLIVMMLVSYFCNLYVIPVAIVCIIIGGCVFFLAGIPIQRGLRKVSRELKELD